MRFWWMVAAALAWTVPAGAADLYAYDASAPLNLTATGGHQEEHGDVTEVRYTLPSGDAATAEIVSGFTDKPRPGFLFVHWLGDPKTTNHTEFENEALELARSGITSVLVDAMWSRPDWFDTVGKDAAADGPRIEAQVIALRRALDLLVMQKGVDPSQIVFVGHDFGAMFGALMANVETRPKLWVFQAGVPTLAQWYRFGKEKHAWPDYGGYAAALARYDIRGGLGKLSGDRVLMQFAEKDFFVTAADREAFAAAVPGRPRTILYPTDHALAIPQVAADWYAWVWTALKH